MKIIRVISIVFMFAAFFCSPAAMAQTVISTTTTVTPGTGDVAVDRRLSAINEQAKGDLKGFVARTSSHFGVPSEIVEGLLNRKMPPADAYMTILLSHITKKPVDNVVEVYDANKGKGWGVIAKQMGIKPGSAGFHALKKDNFGLKDKGKGKGKGKSKGKWADGDD